MGFNNLSWGKLRSAMSGEPSRENRLEAPPSPGIGTHRDHRESGAVPYAELHCHSSYSFLDGASQPEDLVAEAVRLGLTGLAITDHDGMYGVVRLAEAAREAGLPTIFGAELSLGLAGPQAGNPDPDGDHLLVLARDPEGYSRLSHQISIAHRRGGQKNEPSYDLDELAAAHDGHWLILTGCRKGAVRRALEPPGRWSRMDTDAAGTQLRALTDRFGSENVVVELVNHGYPTDSERLDALAALAVRHDLPIVATNAVHYAQPGDGRLAAVVAAVRARRSLAEIDGWLPPAATAHLRSGEEMHQVFARYPTAVANAAAIARDIAFDLQTIRPRLPHCDVPDGHTEMSWLRELTMRGAAERYGPPQAERVPGAYAQLEYELGMIEKLEFPGYFLIVREIVDFCRRENILCQGRGSAANSAVCYALGITAVDAVHYGLLFERFLSPERDGPPDIDIDIENGRREEVIQHVYAKYGRDNAAQVSNVITYRPRSAVRDVAKAFGYAQGQQDAWSKQLEQWGNQIGPGPDVHIPAEVIDMANKLMRFPRHLGIHSGGMVLADRPLTEVVPIEWARMENRTVLQWDKDDCAAAGLVKFDLLGLGALSAVHTAIDLIRDHHGVDIDLATLDLEDPPVYAMLREADTVGVFQVESRAQMATLPRLQPNSFYDLACQVALIRPGPIQGESVHPFIRRRRGEEPVSYVHPLLENATKKTLGVPLFQEQLMQMVVDGAGFTAAGADQLRRAMGSKRSAERMDAIRDQLYGGMASKGITGQAADIMWKQITAFSAYGFPESHAISFALIAFATSWLKRYYPAAYTAAVLANQPMGFYTPQSLVADARRHGVRTLRPDINASLATATIEPDPDYTGPPVPPGYPPSGAPPRLDYAIRLGLAEVRSIGSDLADRIVAERDTNGPYTSMINLAERVDGLTTAHLEALATGGIFDNLGISRREALWNAGPAAAASPTRLPVLTTPPPPPLPGMSAIEVAAADMWATSTTPDGHPVEHVRASLTERGAMPIGALADVEGGTRVHVGGIVTHRQRPPTAGGITFMNLEDETGMLNVLVSPGLWKLRRDVFRNSAGLLVRGILQRSHGSTTLVADRVEHWEIPVRSSSRDFQ